MNNIVILFSLVVYFYNIFYIKNIILSYSLFAIIVYIIIIKMIKYDKTHNYKGYTSIV
jgi:hypothetical protein